MTLGNYSKDNLTVYEQHEYSSDRLKYRSLGLKYCYNKHI